MSEPVAIVTGAGSGIGRATAHELAAAGYRVVLVGRKEASLTQTASELAAASLVVPADVASPQAVQRVVDRATAEYGRVDAAIHCAALAPQATLEQTSVELWRAVVDTSLSAAFYLARSLWPVFKRQGGGVLVNISSYAARDPFPGFAAYASAKAGLHLLGLVLAREGKPLGVRVHTVAPAAVETAMFRAIVSPQQVPSEQCLRPAEVARVIRQCVCGDLIHTSGEVIYVHQ